MTSIQYVKIIKYFKENKLRSSLLFIVSKIFPYINAVMYISLIFYLLYFNNNKIYKVIIIPALVFLLVSVLRKIINRTRPYDELKFEPFFSNVKRNKGKSFPSRHASSAFIIAFAMLYVNVYLGVVGFVFSVFIALSRVLTGVHYPKDIIGGFFISFIFAMIGFYLI